MNLFYIANQIELLAAQLKEMEVSLKNLEGLSQKVERFEKHFEKLNSLDELYDLVNRMKNEISEQSENAGHMEEKYREEKNRMTEQLLEQQKSSERLRLEMEKILHEKEERLNYAQNQYRELYEMTRQIQEEGKKWRSKYIRLKKDMQSE